jgi:pimeloyl-ACP methyl ester carboxylesterase
MLPHFVERGTPTPGQASLVLLHAFPLDHRMWLPVADRLAADGVHVVLPDAPGLGGSALPPGPDEADPDVPDLATAADRIAALLDHLLLPDAVLAGVSMGGYTALAFATRHPQRLRGLALVDTKASADGDEARANRERIAHALLGEAGVRALAPMTATLLGRTSHDTRPDVVAEVRRQLEAAPAAGAAWSQRAMAARPDRTALLTQLAGAGLRSVVVVGQQDSLTPVTDSQVLALALHCPLVVVPDAGHLSPIEDPDAVTRALRLLLAEVHEVPAEVS